MLKLIKLKQGVIFLMCWYSILSTDNPGMKQTAKIDQRMSRKLSTDVEEKRVKL